MPLIPRRQLPAYSPISAGAFVRSLAARTTRRSAELRRAHDLVGRTFSADAVLLADSGRSALQLAITTALAHAGARRVVGIPAFTCFEVATAAVGAADCQISLYDVDPNTLSPDLASVESALERGARVFVFAPLYGVPFDWDAISALMERHGAIAIEDAAQGHGATWRGKRLGSLGVLSVVSFGRGKGWTGGGGGALIARGEIAGQVAKLEHEIESAGPISEARLLAATAVQWLAGRPSLYELPASTPSLGLGQTTYHPPEKPRRPSPISAALLRRSFADSEAEARLRRDNAARLIDAMPVELRERIPTAPRLGVAGYLRLPIRLPAWAFDLASTPAAARAGIAKSYPATLDSIPDVASRLVSRDVDWPGARQLVRELATLPCHSRLSAADVATIVALLTPPTSRAFLPPASARASVP